MPKNRNHSENLFAESILTESEKIILTGNKRGKYITFVISHKLNKHEIIFNYFYRCYYLS